MGSVKEESLRWGAWIFTVQMLLESSKGPFSLLEKLFNISAIVLRTPPANSNSINHQEVAQSSNKIKWRWSHISEFSGKIKLSALNKYTHLDCVINWTLARRQWIALVFFFECVCVCVYMCVCVCACCMCNVCHRVAVKVRWQPQIGPHLLPYWKQDILFGGTTVHIILTDCELLGWSPLASYLTSWVQSVCDHVPSLPWLLGF